MTISFALVDPTGHLLEEIADKRMHQKDIALTYALAMNEPNEVDWRTVNHAIMDRWSLAGLKRVKTLAWRHRRSAASSEERT